MMRTTFTTKILAFGNNTGIEVPAKNLSELNAGKRPQVRVTANKYQFSSTIGTMNGKYLISFSKAHRDTSGLSAGDMITVLLELDTSPRDTPLPVDAASAIKSNKLQDAWDSQAPSHKKEYVRWITESKKPETRENRIKKMIEMLGSK